MESKRKKASRGAGKSTVKSNFEIDQHTKDLFKAKCVRLHTDMGDVLADYIREFVRDPGSPPTEDEMILEGVKRFLRDADRSDSANAVFVSILTKLEPMKSYIPKSENR